MSDGLITLESSELYEETDAPDKSVLLSAPSWTWGLTWLCIFSVIISFFGVISALFGIFMIMIQPSMTESFSVSGADPAIMTYWSEYIEAMRPYRPVLIFQQFVKFGLAASFGVGFLMMVCRSKNARSFMLTVCAGAILYHVLGAALYFLTYSSVQEATADVGRSTMESINGSQQQSEEAMDSMMQWASLYTTISLIVGLSIKGIFYGGFMQMLTAPAVRMVFGENPYPEVQA